MKTPQALFAFILSLLWISILAGCSDDQPPSKAPAPQATSPTSPVPLKPSSSKPTPPPSPPGLVTRASFGPDWPLTVDSAMIGHDERGGVTLTIRGTTYAVNGSARDEHQYADFTTSGYWAEDRTFPGTKKDIGPIIDKGLKLPVTAP